jgi:hypothetical protein
MGAAAGLAGCAAGVDCGPGTQRKQLASGDLVCAPVDVAKGDTSCDADGGVMLVAGSNCVSTLQCGPGTVRDPASNECLPIQKQPHEPDACPPPGSGQICVNGTVRNFVDGSFLNNQTVRVSIFDPSAFFGGAVPPPLGDSTTTDTFVFKNIPASGSGYILVVTADPMGATATYEPTGIGGSVNSGQSIRVDGYVITRQQTTSWSTTAGINWDTNGGLIYRMFNDPPPPANARTPTETHPVAGAQLIDGATMNPPPGVKYFKAQLADGLDATATATSASGGAILTSTGFPTYTASGGGVSKWEAHQALTIKQMLQIDFLHPMP